MEHLPETVDRDILVQRVMSALMAIREASDCTLHEAIDIFAQRYEELRRDRPDDFTLRREDYGHGFYS
ncbi:hypothetical protein [Streptomyces sp. NPDC126503]|uniref:hypothetical protein n=1 Tax=Streptomyces sp. NPDC126503 TaxID=3155315 RepID=UPI0033325BAE